MFLATEFVLSSATQHSHPAFVDFSHQPQPGWVQYQSNSAVAQLYDHIHIFSKAILQ
jgi:hypothetical protein